MDKQKRYQELVARREKIVARLDNARLNLGHPHLDFMSAHELAESDFKVYTAYLEEVDKEIEELKVLLKIK